MIDILLSNQDYQDYCSVPEMLPFQGLRSR